MVSSNVLMPTLSPTMEEGKLAKWLVKEGDDVAIGDVIAEIETDMATMEVEANEEGKLGRILVSEGAGGIKVNSPIAVIFGQDDEPGDVIRSDVADGGDQTNGFSQSKSVQKQETAVSGSANLPAAPSAIPDPIIAGGMEIAPGVEMIELSVREALRDAMAEEMRRDKEVFLLGEEVAQYHGAYKVSQGLLEEFGEMRVIDTPITEHGFSGLAVGAAFTGLKPVVEFMTFNFAMQAMDHIINSAAKTLYMSGGQMLSAITFRGPNGAASRVAAQHSQDYSAWYAQVPGLKVIMPYAAADAKGLLKAAIRDPNPVVFLENELLYGHKSLVPKIDDFTVPIGKARIARPGNDATIVSWGIGMRYSEQAADELAKQGIEVEIVDLRTLRPIDEQAIIRSVSKTGRCVTVEEGWPRCSMSAEVAAIIMAKGFDYLDAPVLRVTGKDVPMPYAANLEKLALPSVGEVIEAVKAVCYK